MNDNAFSYPGEVYEIIRSYYRNTDLERQFLADIGIGQGSRVIDFGCGTGTLSRLMAENGATVLGLDPSHEFINYANDASSSKNTLDLTFKVGEIPEMERSGGTDFVICAFNSISYSTSFGEISDSLSQFFSALKSGGVLVVEIAMYLRLFENFKPQMTINHRSGDLSLCRQINHACDWYNGFLEHDEFVTIARDGSPVTTHHEKHRQLVIIPAFLSTLLEQAGFSDIEWYTHWSKSKVIGSESTVTFVARKT